jgi:hypothetical protein
MIIVPKYKDILVRPPTVRCGVGGEFRVIRYNCMGQVNYDSGWLDNMIVNQGLGLQTTEANWNNYTYIGSDATAVTATDTTMGSLLAYSATLQGSPTRTGAGASPWWVASERTHRFAAGVGTGTVREIGVGEDTAATKMVSRIVIPTPVSKAADQVLDVIWRHKLYPPLGDVTGTVTIDGAVYDTTVRGLYYDYVGSGTQTLGQFGPNTASGSNQGVADGNLGALDDTTPLGTTANSAESRTWLTGGVTGTTGYREWDVLFGLNYGNLGAGIRTAWTRTNTSQYFQCQFDRQSDGARVDKDDTKIWTPRWRLEWVRH